MNIQVADKTTAPGANTNTTNLFTTVDGQAPARLFAGDGVRRLILDLLNSHAGTLRWYSSEDRGTNWSQIGEQSVAAVASNDSNLFDFFVAPYKDFKLDWVNGGSAQTTWRVAIELTDQGGPIA